MRQSNLKMIFEPSWSYVKLIETQNQNESQKIQQ